VAGAQRLGDLPARDPDEAWLRRQRRYEDWLDQEGTFVLTASLEEQIAGFALVTVSSGYDGWRSGDRVGELRDLVVAARLRGRGIGSSLLEAVRRELAREGINEYRLNIVAGNATAEEFYLRHGLVSVSQVMLGRTSDGEMPDAGGDPATA
jgi:GNAT superfamily N-acetyltransferase